MLLRKDKKKQQKKTIAYSFRRNCKKKEIVRQKPPLLAKVKE